MKDTYWYWSKLFDKDKIKEIGILHNSPLDSKESAERLLNNLKSNYVNIFDKNGEIEK